MKFALSLFSLVFALNTTPVTFAADNIIELEDGSFVDLNVKAEERNAVDFTADTIGGISTLGRSSCTILSHTSYLSPSGSACVRCGSSLVMVHWVTYNDSVHYSGHLVGACSGSLEPHPIKLGNGVLSKTIELEILRK